MKIIRTTNQVLSIFDEDNNFETGEYYDLETQPSLTDPSQAMEIKDILNMFSRGGTVRVLRAQNFGEEIPKEFEALASRIHTLDKTERAQEALDLKELINTKSESIDSNQKDIANKKIIAKAKAEAKAEAQKEKQKQNPEKENE